MGKELRESRLLAPPSRGRIFTQFLTHKSSSLGKIVKMSSSSTAETMAEPMTLRVEDTYHTYTVWPQLSPDTY